MKFFKALAHKGFGFLPHRTNMGHQAGDFSRHFSHMFALTFHGSWGIQCRLSHCQEAVVDKVILARCGCRDASSSCTVTPNSGGLIGSDHAITIHHPGNKVHARRPLRPSQNSRIPSVSNSPALLIRRGEYTLFPTPRGTGHTCWLFMGDALRRPLPRKSHGPSPESPDLWCRLSGMARSDPAHCVQHFLHAADRPKACGEFSDTLM